MTGGDGLTYALSLDQGAQAVATTHTAERAYASAGGAARVEVRLQLAAGASLDWRQQETIQFDRTALTRRTLADMAADARLPMPDCRCQTADTSLLMLEMLVLGRAALGEQVRTLDPFRPAKGPARRAAGAGRPGAADIGVTGRPSGAAGATPRHCHFGAVVAGGNAAAGPGTGAAGGIGWR